MAKLIILGNQARAMVNFWTVLINMAKEAGHEILCLVPHGDPETSGELEKLGVRVGFYPLDRKGINPARDLKTLSSLYAIFRVENPDVVFAYTIKPVIYGGLAARLAGVKRRFSAITGLGYAFEADSFFKKNIQKLAICLYSSALKGAKAVFFQNEEDKKIFIDKGIMSRGTKIILTKGTGVDTKRFTPGPDPEGPPSFLLVGRLLEAKGLYEYAAAARLLKKKYPEARFQILGPPEQGLGSVPLDTVKLWQEEGIIEYLGQTRDVRPYVAKSGVMVLPSWREGTPCSIMEGMAMGRAAVVTDVPGCREVVRNGVNGYMTPARDPEALASAMEAFILNPGLISSMGRAGRKMAEDDFDAVLVANQMLSIMELR